MVMMKSKSAIMVLGIILLFVSSSSAAPILQVDIGGDFSTGGPQVVQAGWDAFSLHELVPNNTVTHTYGGISMSITATIYGEVVGYTFNQGPFPVGVTIPSVYNDAALANV